jgi:hypothetical protein
VSTRRSIEAAALGVALLTILLVWGLASRHLGRVVMTLAGMLVVLEVVLIALLPGTPTIDTSSDDAPDEADH